ncbi:MAG: hypothetical protein LBU25_08520 [Treponema sp.]|jgi:hypothetical protein|nr:hypothetical protein [Treponema sp.]
MDKRTIRSVLFALIPALTLALFPGCDNGNPGEGTPTEISMVKDAPVYLQNNTTPYTGSGTIKIAYNWDDNPLYLPDLPNGAGTVTDGKLTLNLPATVPEDYLETIKAVFKLSDSATVSSQDAKIFRGRFCLVNDKTYWLFYEKIAPSEEYYISYVYSPEAVSVIGVERAIETNENNEKSYSWVKNYNLRLKKGWNLVYIVTYILDDSKNIETVTYSTDLSNSMPSGMEWVLNLRYTPPN